MVLVFCVHMVIFNSIYFLLVTGTCDNMQRTSLLIAALTLSLALIILSTLLLAWIILMCGGENKYKRDSLSQELEVSASVTNLLYHCQIIKQV